MNRLEIKTSMLFNLVFVNDDVLTCFFFFFRIIDFYFLFPAVIEQIFYSIAEFVIPIGIPSKGVIDETEIYSVFVEAKIRNHSI